MKRFIIEMGMGNDQHGEDYTKAAARAIEDALRHSSLPLFGALGISHEDMEVRVTVAVQQPEKLEIATLESCLPRGRVTITPTHGGLNITNPDSGAITVIAQAAVEAFLPDPS